MAFPRAAGVKGCLARHSYRPSQPSALRPQLPHTAGSRNVRRPFATGSHVPRPLPKIEIKTSIKRWLREWHKSSQDLRAKGFDPK